MNTILEIIIIILLAAIIGLFFLGLSRKIMARIHWRYGPPIAQPVIDIIKLFNQTSMSHGKLFNFGIIFSLSGSVVVLLFLPLGEMCPLSSSGGLLVILYCMLIAPLGLALSGGEAANPITSIGISRKFLLAFGYELPLLLILLTVMTHFNTISIVDIVNMQLQTGWSFQHLPLLLSGIAYILILPAILDLRPFELIQAPQEISSGPMIEYGGKFLALATIQHAFNVFISLSLFTNLFLGGAENPGYFFLKMLIVFIILLFVNAVTPRFRIEQAIKFLWRWPALLAFAGLIIVSVTG
ncbi:MAG: NADH-quinone oxidoreductase subunit H [Bacteroidales bacterium]|nr:NADH-quinone oxidoreductase subunit H [Bacteroidales bacterium]